jgi:hypothetical protein
MHKRKEIKEQIEIILKAQTAYKVFRSRYLPITAREFDAICIYAPNETDEKSKDQESYFRNQQVFLCLYTKGKDLIEDLPTGDKDIDGRLDEMTSEVEAVFLKQFETLNKIVLNFNLRSTKYMIDDKNEDIIGIAYMEWEAIYYDKII